MTTDDTTAGKVSLAAVREHIKTSETFTRTVTLDPEGLKVKAKVHIVPTDQDVMRKFAAALQTEAASEEQAQDQFRAVCDYIDMMVVEWDLDVAPTSDALYDADDGLVVGVFAGWVYKAVTDGPKGISSSSVPSTRPAKTSRRK